MAALGAAPAPRCLAMNRASARSSCSSSKRRRRVATSRTAWRSRPASRCWTATSISRIDACCRASSRPVAPKSMSPSRPPCSTKTFPGCGSAWKRPSTSICFSAQRSSALASRARSNPMSWIVSPSRTLGPSSQSMTRTRAVDSSRWTTGTWTSLLPARPAAISVALRASWRKSSSSRSRSANLPASSVTWYSAPQEVRASTVRASSVRTSRSRSTDSAIPGRWTLTTTCSPVRRRARYAWPIEAAAIGSGSNSLNASLTGRPARPPGAVDLLLGAGVTWSWRRDTRRRRSAAPGRPASTGAGRA